MVNEQLALNQLKKDCVFSKRDYYELLSKNGYRKTEKSFLVYFQKLINNGKVCRVGRNAYCVAEGIRGRYSYQYSELAQNVAACIQEDYPDADFVIFETLQLNEFVNHQIGRNTVFVFVDSDVIDFVFDTLRNVFANQVMLSPGIQEFHRYRNENSIVLVRLVSEAPKSAGVFWHTSIEKMLVDVMADVLVRETFSESEYKSVYEEAFGRYVVDENKMFRYARRRNAEARIRAFLRYHTGVKFSLEKKL